MQINGKDVDRRGIQVGRDEVIRFELDDAVSVEVYKRRLPDGKEVIVLCIPYNQLLESGNASTYHTLQIRPGASNLVFIGTALLVEKASPFEVPSNPCASQK